jgi:hypothetical protein
MPGVCGADLLSHSLQQVDGLLALPPTPTVSDTLPSLFVDSSDNQSRVQNDVIIDSGSFEHIVCIQ